MGRIFDNQNNPELNAYYSTEYLENTDFEQYDNLDVRKPDSFIGLTSNVFLNPLMPLVNIGDDNDLEWYNEI